MTKSKILLATAVASFLLVGCSGGSGNGGGDVPGGKAPEMKLPLAEGSFQESVDTKYYYTSDRTAAGSYGSNCVETNNDYYFESDNFMVYGPRNLPETDFRYAAFLAEEGYRVTLNRIGVTDEQVKALRPVFTPELFKTLEASGIFEGINTNIPDGAGGTLKIRQNYPKLDNPSPDSPASYLSYWSLDENGEYFDSDHEGGQRAANHFYRWVLGLTREQQIDLILHRGPDDLEAYLEEFLIYGMNPAIAEDAGEYLIEPQRNAKYGRPTASSTTPTSPPVDLVPEKFVVCLNPDMPAASGIKGQATFYGMNLIPFSAYKDTDIASVVFHEAVHMITANISHRLTPESRTDVWWEEGLAVVLSGQGHASSLDTPTDVVRFTTMEGVVNFGMDMDLFYDHAGLAVHYLLRDVANGGAGNTVDENFVDLLLAIRASDQGYAVTQDRRTDENGDFINDFQLHAYPAFEDAFNVSIQDASGELMDLNEFKSTYLNRIDALR